MADQLMAIRLNRFISLIHQPNQIQSPEASPAADDIISLILFHLNQWLAAISANAGHWLLFVVGGLLLLCFICCCLPTILSCIAWVFVSVFSLLIWIIMIPINCIKSVFRCLCCCCGSERMMIAPGRGGRVSIPRFSFEANPAAYFQNLRATPSYLR